MKRNRGFTLVELLVVIAIIAVLAAFLLSSLGTLRKVMIKLECATNLSKVSKIFAAYAKEFDGLLPCFGSTTIYEKNGGVGGTPPTNHLMIETLTRLGATPEVFSCPAHALRSEIDGGNDKYNWKIGSWWVGGSAGWQKYYKTPGYIWFAHSENFTRHPRSPFGVIPSHWSTWTRFYNGAFLPERNDSVGNPPIAADYIQIYKGGLYGFWHDMRRETVSGQEDDERVLDYGGGGHTLFLNGDVTWASWGELEALGYAYEAQDDRYTYFLLEKPDTQ
jgi:prepilin-type N-terminal cleavage/methylation domain-containing protein